MKVMTIVGTRPEVIKLSRVIHELDKHISHVLVHTGQNYDFELNGIFFEELGIRRPDYYLDAVGESVAQTIGNVIAKSDEVFARELPDAVLLLGDTNSCLAAIGAKRRKIPIFHMEAGNRCFDLRVPEEINRRIVDHISDINMTYTEHARRYLLSEGLRPETVIKTGSPMKEVLAYHADQIEASDILSRLDLIGGQYFVVSAHREENVDSEQNFENLLSSLSAIAERFDKPVIVSTHPRTRRRLEERSRHDFDPRIRFIKPLGFPDYVGLQASAACVVSDSGTITEEASLLGLAAVTIRQAHERPEGMDAGTLIMCGLEAESVVRSIEIIMAQHAEHPARRNLVNDYEVDNVAQKVLRIILSYTDYVNRNVWRKHL